MFRRVLGALAAASALLMSWVAVSQPGSSEPPAPQRPVQLLGAAFRSGPAPVPGGAPGHYLLQH
ncbi:MAG TPA: hypothetical protein VF794_21085, partial [Archangium sp.]|uniref:hypothetical protein n=1 Tax=Archangium sp. TaxID=1872627 RepID=UPI002EDA1647